MKKIIVAAVMLSAASATFAQDTGFYAGASAGYAKFKMDMIDEFNDIHPDISMDDTGTGYKLTAGYSFNENFAVEAFYINGLSLDMKYDGGAPGYSLDGKMDMSGLGLAAVLKKPISDSANIYGKLGALRSETDIDLSMAKPADTYSAAKSVTLKGSEKDTAGMIGFGAEYRFDAVSLKAEYEIFNKSGDQVHFLSAGVAYNF